MQSHSDGSIVDSVDVTLNPGGGRPFVILQFGFFRVYAESADDARAVMAAGFRALRILDPDAAVIVRASNQQLYALEEILPDRAAEPGHAFIRPGQVAADRPAPDKCMQCGQAEAAHVAPVFRSGDRIIRKSDGRPGKVTNTAYFNDAAHVEYDRDTATPHEAQSRFRLELLDDIEHEPASDVKALTEAGSLGTPGARKLRARAGARKVDPAPATGHPLTEMPPAACSATFHSAANCPDAQTEADVPDPACVVCGVSGVELVSLEHEPGYRCWSRAGCDARVALRAAGTVAR